MDFDMDQALETQKEVMRLLEAKPMTLEELQQQIPVPRIVLTRALQDLNRLGKISHEWKTQTFARVTENGKIIVQKQSGKISTQQ